MKTLCGISLSPVGSTHGQHLLLALGKESQRDVLPVSKTMKVFECARHRDVDILFAMDVAQPFLGDRVMVLPHCKMPHDAVSEEKCLYNVFVVVWRW